MKKIMFNEKYGLTAAVLNGDKTMTRRIIPLTDADRDYLDNAFDWDLRESVIIDRYAQYKVGEIVAVGQCYRDIIDQLDDRMKEYVIGYYSGSKAWTNKMFIRPDLMPRHIRITDVDLQRLQSISDEDCLKEGILKEWDNSFSTPRKAFAALIDRISSKGTWECNPWVFAYSFELID